MFFSPGNYPDLATQEKMEVLWPISSHISNPLMALSFKSYPWATAQVQRGQGWRVKHRGITSVRVSKHSLGPWDHSQRGGRIRALSSLCLRSHIQLLPTGRECASSAMTHQAHITQSDTHKEPSPKSILLSLSAVLGCQKRRCVETSGS